MGWGRGGARARVNRGLNNNCHLKELISSALDEGV